MNPKMNQAGASLRGGRQPVAESSQEDEMDRPVTMQDLESINQHLMEEMQTYISRRLSMVEMRLVQAERLLESVKGQLLSNPDPVAGLTMSRAIVLVSEMKPPMRLFLTKLLACENGLSPRDVEAKACAGTGHTLRKLVLDLEKITALSSHLGGVQPVEIRVDSGTDAVHINGTFRKVFLQALAILATSGQIESPAEDAPRAARDVAPAKEAKNPKAPAIQVETAVAGPPSMPKPAPPAPVDQARPNPTPAPAPDPIQTVAAVSAGSEPGANPGPTARQVLSAFEGSVDVSTFGATPAEDDPGDAGDTHLDSEICSVRRFDQDD